MVPAISAMAFSIGWNTSVSVSYTHLDVYKRQLYDDVGCWKVPHAFFDEMRGAGIEARSFLKVRFPLSVSYTHLDVYKRQE